MGMIHSATVKVIKKDRRITKPSDIRSLETIGEGEYVKITIEKIDRSKKNDNHLINIIYI